MTNTGPKDHCTGWFEWIGDTYIGGCCKLHDQAYEIGLPRLQSDWDLGTCVSELGLEGVGTIMMLTVMAIGWTRYKRKK